MGGGQSVSECQRGEGVQTTSKRVSSFMNTPLIENRYVHLYNRLLLFRIVNSVGLWGMLVVCYFLLFFLIELVTQLN